MSVDENRVWTPLPAVRLYPLTEEQRRGSASQGAVLDLPILPRVFRAALFTLVGVFFLVIWLWLDPSYQESASQSEWSHVLGFSAAILVLAFVLPLFAQLVGGRRVFRVSLVPAAGAALASLSNIVEDGLQMGWAFWGFILSTAIIDLGLLALTVLIAYGGRGGYRLLAVVPAVTLAAMAFWVIAGGIIMLAAWLGAAALALALPAHTAARVAPALP